MDKKFPVIPKPGFIQVKPNGRWKNISSKQTQSRKLLVCLQLKAFGGLVLQDVVSQGLLESQFVIQMAVFTQYILRRSLVIAQMFTGIKHPIYRQKKPGNCASDTSALSKPTTAFLHLTLARCAYFFPRLHIGATFGKC